MWKPNLLTEIEADLLAEIKALINPPRPKRQLEFPVKKLERIPPPRRLIDFMGPDGERQRQKCQELVLQRYRELARPPQGLPSSPTPTLEAEEIARARRFDRYNCDLKKARLNFWEDFKFRYDDKERVDEELLKFLEAEPESKITPLLIALKLREGFGNRPKHRPRRSEPDEQNHRSAIRYSWRLEEKYLSEGLSRGDAADRARKEAAAAHQITESVLRSERGTAKYRHLTPPNLVKSSPKRQSPRRR